MICSSCSTELAPQTTICGTCGHLIEDPLIGTMINDRYLIQAKLAVGGFGSIYRATQVKNNRKVAIKVMHAELSEDRHLVARFRREAVTLCSLRDAHTVTTYELDHASDGRPFLVMELLEGRNLLELFRATGPLPWRRMLAIARAVCSALSEAHGLGIVHRDLKPANIFLEDRAGGDFVKVLDFGIAKIMQGSGIDDGSELTVTGQAVGTLEYMAPEQLIGGNCDGRTDIYTLGVVAYEMIVGRRPFASAGVLDLLSTQLAQKPPKPGLFVPLPGAVSDLLLRCLEREETARYPDVDALAAAIEEVLAQSDMELLATRTSTTRGHAAPRKVASYVTPASAVPHIMPSPAFGLEAPSAGRLVEDPAGSAPPMAAPAPAGSHAGIPAPLSPLAYSGPAAAPHLANGPVTTAPPAPRLSGVRIALLMFVLAGAGVGAGLLISRLGL